MALKSKEFLKKFLGRVPFVRRFAEDEKGATLVYVALSLPVILGFAGIGVDIAVWNLDKRQSQSMADAAVMEAGVSVLRTGGLAVINNWARDGAVRNGFGNTGMVATANGFSNAAGETIIINNPPSVGVFSAAVFGDPDGDGIFGDTDAIEVFVRRPAPSLLSSMVLDTSNQFVQSRAVIRAINDPGESCFMALDPDGSISMSGTPNVTLDCGAMTNGTLDVDGSACLTATSVGYVAGDDSGTNCGTNTPGTPTITRPDPLRFMPEVEDRVCDKNSPTSVNNNQTEDIYPPIDGVLVFCADVTVKPGGTMIFHPGVYVFHQGAQLDVKGTLDASAGVLFYFTEDASMATQGDPVLISASADVTINALEPGDLDAFGTCTSNLNNYTPAACTVTTPGGDPVTDLDDTYEGIAIFQDRDAKAANGGNSVDKYDFGGGGNLEVNGIVYLPGANVEWAGGSGTTANAIVADSLSLVGNSSFGTIEGTVLENLLAYTFIKLVE